jgi:hypothetical protein
MVFLSAWTPEPESFNSSVRQPIIWGANEIAAVLTRTLGVNIINSLAVARHYERFGVQ